MDNMTIIAIVSIICRRHDGYREYRTRARRRAAVSTALTSLAQQPDASSTITRTL